MNSVQHTINHSESPAPRVSVIVPAYNTAAFIGETLDSVFGQTFQGFELIVINDGSPDTPELEVALQAYMSRIRYIRQENRGPSGARNAGIRLAQGELVAFVDSDDIWMPEYLSAQVQFLDCHPGVHASIADALLFDSFAEPVVWRMLKAGAGPVLNFEQMLKREGGQAGGSAMVARRQRVLQVGMFDEQLRIAEDFEFCARLCFPDGSIGYLGQVLVKYRQHQGSITDEPRRRKPNDAETSASRRPDDAPTLSLFSRRYNVAEIDALRRLGKKLDLTEAQRVLLAEEIAAAEAAVALNDAFDHLSADRFRQGERCLAEANTYFGDPRITVTRFGLKTFPRWTARMLNKRLKRHAGR
jgi:glycosyltransferase involved in cell wall biosynthesis